MKHCKVKVLEVTDNLYLVTRKRGKVISNFFKKGKRSAKKLAKKLRAECR